MKKEILLSFFLIASIISFAQEEQTKIITVGTAEREIEPDEIYMIININERKEGKDIYTVEDQETKVREKLESVGIPLDQLTISDGGAYYGRIKFNEKGLIENLELQLMVTNADDVLKVFKSMDEIGVNSVRIDRVDHSKREEIVRELKIQAIKDAKSEADQLLEAIGQKTGKATFVYSGELSESEIQQIAMYAGMDRRFDFNFGKSFGNADAYRGNTSVVHYRKMTITEYVSVVFEIN